MSQGSSLLVMLHPVKDRWWRSSCSRQAIVLNGTTNCESAREVSCASAWKCVLSCRHSVGQISNLVCSSCEVRSVVRYPSIGSGLGMNFENRLAGIHRSVPPARQFGHLPGLLCHSVLSVVSLWRSWYCKKSLYEYPDIEIKAVDRWMISTYRCYWHVIHTFLWLFMMRSCVQATHRKKWSSFVRRGWCLHVICIRYTDAWSAGSSPFVYSFSYIGKKYMQVCGLNARDFTRLLSV